LEKVGCIGFRSLVCKVSQQEISVGFLSSAAFGMA
jgi:hypothetical protein